MKISNVRNTVVPVAYPFSAPHTITVYPDAMTPTCGRSKIERRMERYGARITYEAMVKR